MSKDFTRIEDICNRPPQKEKLKNYIDEAVRCKQRQADEAESLKDIIGEARHDLNIDPKLMRQLVNITFRNSFTEKQAEISTLETAIELLLTSADDSAAA